jgi:uncharacterized membrane-anchored protein
MVLIGVYVNAAYPLWTGQDILLATRPVDPRSLLRGNYALLRYEISTLPAQAIVSDYPPRNGEKVYVSLQADNNGVYRFVTASLTRPDQGVFIQGRLRNRQSEAELDVYQVTYGIEAYFAPKEKALALEKILARGAHARVSVAGSGKAALQAVIKPASSRLAGGGENPT